MRLSGTINNAANTIVCPAAKERNLSNLRLNAQAHAKNDHNAFLLPHGESITMHSSRACIKAHKQPYRRWAGGGRIPRQPGQVGNEAALTIRTRVVRQPLPIFQHTIVLISIENHPRSRRPRQLIPIPYVSENQPATAKHCSKKSRIHKPSLPIGCARRIYQL